jgi:hypothetical protein
MSAFEVSYVLLWTVICILLLGMAALYSALGVLVPRPAPGRSSLDMSSVGPSIGELVDVPDTRGLDGTQAPGSTSSWIFVSPNCAGCERVKQRLQNSSDEVIGGRVVLASRGPETETMRWAAEIPSWVSVIADQDEQLFSRFNVRITPFYIRLDAEGRCIAKGVKDDILFEEAPNGAESTESAGHGAVPVTAGLAPNGRRTDGKHA